MTTEDPSVSEFDAAVLEYPPGEPDYAFSAHLARSRAVTVSVEPWRYAPWTASFAAPDPGSSALSGLFGTPTPTGLCVVERGTAFLGDVRDPSGFAVVETNGPVVAAKRVATEGKLLLLTRWSIVAIGFDGVLWASDRIAIDGLRVDEVSGGWARGVADPDDDEPRDFALDLSSGNVIGGALLNGSDA